MRKGNWYKEGKRKRETERERERERKKPSQNMLPQNMTPWQLSI